MRRLLRALEVPLLVLTPLVLGICAYVQFDQAALLTVLVAVVTVVVFLASYEASRPGLRQVVPTVVLAALAAAGRILFAAVPDFKPVTAVCIIAGVALGRREGFMTGALAALVSNIFFGQGLWTAWQMYSWGLVGYLSGVLADHGAFRRRLVLYVFGFVSALLYGFVLNSWFIVGYVRPVTWSTALAAYAAGLPWDCTHGAATVIFLLALYLPWQRKLERIKRKFALADLG